MRPSALRSSASRAWLTIFVTLALAASSFVLDHDMDPAADLDFRGVTYAAASGGTPLTLNVPVGVTENDLLVAVVATNGPKAPDASSGWELLRTDARGGEISQTIWTKRATGPDPASYDWPGGNGRMAQTGALMAVGGADLGKLRIVSSGGTAHRSDPVVVPSLDVESAGALLLGAFALNGAGALKIPSTMTVDGSLQSTLSVTTAHEAVGAGPTGDYRLLREVSGGAVGQLVVIERVHVPADDDGSADDYPADDGSDTGKGESDDDSVSGDEGSEDPEDGGDEGTGDSSGGDESGDGSDAGSDPEGDDTGHGDHHTDPVDADHSPSRWNDADTWPSGRVPTSGDEVIVEGHVVIEGPASARTVTITEGSTLEFDPYVSTHLEAHGNVVVYGRLKMTPSDASIEHTLSFIGVDESRYVGGGHAVLDSDVGLWFTDDGRAILKGSERTSWTRAAATLAKGTTAISLEEVPSGWRVGDEIVITPTSPPGTAGHSTGYSHGRVRSIEGATVHLDVPLAFDHPRVADRWGAEVMNMTRNVRIEGTPGGRAHVMFSHTHGAQHLHNVGLRYLGPRQGTGSFSKGDEITEGVLGRYPLHFHHNHEGSVGSMVHNVLVRDSGHRAFVAHASDGITFEGTIAHDVFDSAYWWDRRDTTDGLGHRAVWERGSNDIIYDRAVASLIKADPPFRGFFLSGFELGHGTNMTITNSVAVGVQGNKSASGFHWPEGSVLESYALKDQFVDFWTFDGNVGHNNRVNGVFTWQNTGDPRHIIETSVMYHNGQYGIEHGAYGNRYEYIALDLYGNGAAGINLHAQGEMSFTDIKFDGAGLSRYGFRTTRHNGTSPGATLHSPHFTRYTQHAIAFLSPDTEQLDIINPTFDGPKHSWFHLADHVPANSVIRVQFSDDTAFRLHPASASRGTLVPEWNARTEPIPPFA